MIQVLEYMAIGIAGIAVLLAMFVAIVFLLVSLLVYIFEGRGK